MFTGSLYGPVGLGVAAAITVAISGYLHWGNERLALRAMRARPISEFQAPHLYTIVRELSTAVGQPMPRLYVSPTEATNAFATGQEPGEAALCITEGALRILTERELRAVIGHELSHIYNRDTLVAATSGAVAFLVMFLAFSAWMIPIGRPNDEDGNPGIFGILMSLILGPFAAVIIRLALSRTRENEADACGARLTNDPLAMASALRKLQAGATQLPLPPEPRLQAISHMMIAHPFRSTQGFSRLFAFHPPMSERIARLNRMADEGETAEWWVVGEPPTER
ncbi:M48 family metalloprotease [Streptomyces sp. NPDC057611]|uniref:M48 family metalloprotease n=1 Tax=Streptomyces sp. NPDC057611 TaxID=3346182 RepID=UPI00367EDD59